MDRQLDLPNKKASRDDVQAQISSMWPMLKEVLQRYRRSVVAIVCVTDDRLAILRPVMMKPWTLQWLPEVFSLMIQNQKQISGKASIPHSAKRRWISLWWLVESKIIKANRQQRILTK